MDPLTSFENSNAKQWDNESNVSFSTTQNIVRAPGNSAAIPRPASVLRPPPGFPPRPPGLPLPAGYPNQSFQGNVQVQPLRLPATLANPNQQRRERRPAPASTRPGSSKPPRDLWAEPEGLITTRRNRDIQEKAASAAELGRYLHAPSPEEEFSIIGLYIWDKDETPIDLFGHRLEALNNIRTEYRVYIEWNSRQEHLKISSWSNAQHMASVNECITKAIENARVRERMANPLYIIVPPLASTMRTHIRPRVLTRKPRLAKNFELIGGKLTGQEKIKYREVRENLKEDNLIEFSRHLTDNLLELANLKCCMQMRVRFGHVELTRFKSTLINEDGQNLKDFTQMLHNPRLQSTFGRDLEKMHTVMHLRKRIIDWPERFCPAQGRTQTLEEIKFKDTEVVAFRTSDGQHYRIEADIDNILESEREPEYQLGSTRLFVDNRTNRRIDITTIDIEKGIDWQLEVTSDNSIPIPDHLYAIVAGSVSPKTATRVDNLDLKYPDIRLRPPAGTSVEIKSVELRSVIQYMLIDTGYVVEIAIRRQWQGYATRGDPKIAASVSMFHPAWDSEMESIEESTRARDWDMGLSSLFFGKETEGRPLECFIEEVETIQGYLKDASVEEDQGCD